MTGSGRPAAHLRRVAAVLGAGVVGFFAAVVVSLPLYGVLGPVGAIVGANRAIGRTRPWVGEGPPAPVPLRRQAAQWGVLAGGTAPVVAVLLWGDPRAVGDRWLLAVGALSVLLPVVLWLDRRDRPLWPGYAAGAGLLIIVAVATHPLGGLAFLGPAVALSIAAALSGVDHVRRAVDDRTTGTGARWRGWTKSAIAATLVLGVGIAFARVAFAPAARGDPAIAVVFSFPALLALVALYGRLGLLRAAAVACTVQAAGGFWAWAGWVAVARVLDVDPGPPSIFGYAFLMPALGYWAAWRRRPRGVDGGLGTAVVAGVLSLPPVVALTATREMGCGPGGGCTDDFISAGEGLAAIGLTLVALVVTLAVGLGPRRRS